VQIDVKNRPDEYAGSPTFHPTFLYEMLWNLALCYLLVRLDRTRRLRPGTTLPLYVGGYFLGRLWIEAMRVDTATEILGIRVNIWLSIIGIGGALIAVVARGLWRRPDDSDEPYTDGHRWTDPRDEASAEADIAPADTTADPEDSGDSGESEDSRDSGDDGADDVEDGSPADDDEAAVSDGTAEGPPRG
jgi:hypothetical protein